MGLGSVLYQEQDEKLGSMHMLVAPLVTTKPIVIPLQE